MNLGILPEISCKAQSFGIDIDLLEVWHETCAKTSCFPYRWWKRIHKFGFGRLVFPKIEQIAISFVWQLLYYYLIYQYKSQYN